MIPLILLFDVGVNLLRNNKARFETDDFVKIIKGLVADSGTCVFNRIYFDENKAYAIHFGKKLEKYFAKVTPTYPEANVMFVCE